MTFCNIFTEEQIIQFTPAMGEIVEQLYDLY